MANDDKNEQSLLDSLLSLSPEEVLRGLPLEIRSKLLPLLAAIELLQDEELSKDERDRILVIAKQNIVSINQMLNVISSYLKARQDMNNKTET